VWDAPSPLQYGHASRLPVCLKTQRWVVPCSSLVSTLICAHWIIAWQVGGAITTEGTPPALVLCDSRSRNQAERRVQTSTMKMDHEERGTAMVKPCSTGTGGVTGNVADPARCLVGWLMVRILPVRLHRTGAEFSVATCFEVGFQCGRSAIASAYECVWLGYRS
jgi:hypothetical protein